MVQARSLRRSERLFDHSADLDLRQWPPGTLRAWRWTCIQSGQIERTGTVRRDRCGEQRRCYGTVPAGSRGIELNTCPGDRLLPSVDRSQDDYGAGHRGGSELAVGAAANEK